MDFQFSLWSFSLMFITYIKNKEIAFYSNNNQQKSDRCDLWPERWSALPPPVCAARLRCHGSGDPPSRRASSLHRTGRDPGSSGHLGDINSIRMKEKLCGVQHRDTPNGPSQWRQKTKGRKIMLEWKKQLQRKWLKQKVGGKKLLRYARMLKR